jgi:hypothetical protein
MKERLPIVMSTVALVVAVLGWTPFGEAARNLVIPKGSVGAPQLKRNAVTNPKLKNGAVTSKKVLNASLLAEDFKPGQLPAGQKGDKGDPGAPGATNVKVRTATVSVAANSTNGEVAKCEAGERATGGGAVLAAVNNQDAILRSYPTLGTSISAAAGETPTAWFARVFNSTAGARNATIFVVCASP